jgi:hypothetical protein
MGSPDGAPELAPSVFGFRIRTALPLRFLREGGGVESLEIVEVNGPSERPSVEPLGDWALHGTSYPARATLYRVPVGYEYWTTDAGRFLVDFEHGRIEVPASGDELLREQRLHGMPMLLGFAHRGDFSLHAAAVQVGSGAVVLAAPSRFGKTTLAFAFHERGHRLLSEDLVCCRPSDMSVIPGPALARLRPDVWSGAPPRGMKVIAERPDRVFVAPAPGARGSSEPLPLRGIVFLREADELLMEAAASRDAVKDLWHLGFRLPTEEGRAESFRQLTELAGSVPLWNVRRPFRLDALADTVALIVDRTTG